MAQERKDNLSYNQIPDLQEDWGLDPRNGLKYSGQSVQAFIKKYLTITNQNKDEKAARIGFRDMTMYLFANARDKEEWENNGVSTWIDSVPLVIVGTERKIQVTNVNGNNNPYFTTSQSEAIIQATFRSLERDVLATEYTEIMEDVLVTTMIDKGGTGTWTTIDNEKLVKYGETYSVDVMKYLAVGSNRVVIKAVGSSTGSNGQLNVTANLTSMYIQPANFTWNLPFIEGKPYNLGGLNIGGNISKTLMVKLSNETGYTRTYEAYLGANQYINTAYYLSGLEFPTGGTGIYNVELWLETESIESEHLHYNIMCISAAEENTAKLVTISSLPSKVINYSDNKLFEFAVYNGGAATASPSILVKAAVNQNPITLVDEILKDVETNKINVYETNIEIESEEIDMNLVADITLGASTQRAVYKIDNSLSYPPTSEFVFYMNAAQRNNAQDNKDKIINTANNQEISATWTKFAYTDGVDGHTVDENGRKCLLVPAHSQVVIDYSPLTSVGSGKTLVFTYKVRNVADYSEPIITICDNPDSPTFKGIKITPTNILIHSRDLNKSDLTQGIDVKDEETVNVIITLIRNYKVTYGNLAQIYVNGVKARSFEFASNDDWTTPAKIILGNSSSDLYVYSIMDYNKGFDKLDSERNYTASLALSAAKKLMYTLINSVRDDLGNISYDAVIGKYNVMEIEMLNGAELPHKGLSKEYSAYCNVEFSFVDLPMEYKVKVWRFILLKVLIQGQGTTSMNYYLWNLRFRLDKSGNLIVIYPDNTEEIIL